MSSPGISTPNSCGNTPRPTDPPAPPAPAARRPAVVNVAEDWNTAAIIALVVNLIRDKDRLLPDGSNFGVWGDFLEKRMRNGVNDGDYLMFLLTSAVQEQIARSILLASVDRTLRRPMAPFATTQEMFADIHLRFNVITRAAKINAFRRLLLFNIRDHPSSATINMAITDQLNELHQQNINLTRNLPQLAWIGSSERTRIRTGSNEGGGSKDRYGITSFQKQDVRTVNVVQENIRHQREGITDSQPMPASQPLVMQANPVAAVPVSSLPPQHPNNIPDAMDFMVMQAGFCWQCRLPNHLLRECPLRVCANPNRGPARRMPQHWGYNQYPFPQQHGFQPFYPIVAPAGYTGTYPLVQPPSFASCPPRSTDVSSSLPAWQLLPPGNSYQPQYQNNCAYWAWQSLETQQHWTQPAARMSKAPLHNHQDHSARMVELGDLADDLANLHFGHAHVVMANGEPIVDSVATEGNNAFITGQGNFHFDGLNNQRVTIHGVLY
ncbi:hypothetical protein PTTG_28645 [Puccinia triticina 1-1 BBBD Race 1]|uniref:CCHC-type domain-containing protein n=1 Tax=Puccinia triticina (isolate 1-1 / race 1 (BBBD)) TaxID=630390 RepID=A0A180GAN7_PUCT1|nr:hypothetical protein PTTG_28645 [Puccinia triticina 1-1 BBBD Race 1]